MADKQYAMRERLMTNRVGKLTPNQWMDIVTYPLVSLLVFMVPAGFVLLPFMVRMVFRMWVILPVLLLILAAVLVIRAFRYARKPVHFETLHARDGSTPMLMFWKPVWLMSEAGEKRRFTKWLAPRIALDRDRAYHVYYLKEQDDHILLSIVPADHPDSERWQPTSDFEQRLANRQ
jgi:hypothetical protein